jgi:hypothetical protein
MVELDERALDAAVAALSMGNGELARARATAAVTAYLQTVGEPEDARRAEEPEPPCHRMIDGMTGTAWCLTHERWWDDASEAPCPAMRGRRCVVCGGPGVDGTCGPCNRKINGPPPGRAVESAEEAERG